MSLRVREKIASLTDPSLRLAFAIEKNNVGAIQRELQNGADPNFQTLEGATMLMAAIANGHREAAKALLEGGADPNRVSQFGNTVMDLAADASDADSVVMLLEYGALPSDRLPGHRAQAPDSDVQSDAAVDEPVVAEDPVRDEDRNPEWEAEREEYETLLKRQGEKLEKLERARADQPTAGGSAANLKKLLDERADEFQKEQVDRKRLEAELAAQQDLVEETVNEQTAELRREIEDSQTEIDNHKRLSGELVAQCDDLKSLVAAGAAQLETTTTERDKIQASIEEVTRGLKKETGERQGVEVRLAEAVESAKAAAEAHATALKRETEERVRIEKQLSDERDQLRALAEERSGQLEEQTVARQCLEEDLAALRAASEKELNETKAALEAALESKTQFLAAMGQQIQSHLGAGADGTAEPESNAEDQGDDAKVTPLRRATA